MLITCSRCHSERVRTTQDRSVLGHLKNLLGVLRFRCEECQHQFEASIWRARYLIFAKCPRCHRMDLSKWNTEHYNPPALTRFMVGLGARQVRCEYCRNNFWSFRFIKERFSAVKRSGRSRVRIPASDPGSGTAADLSSLHAQVKSREAAEVKPLSTVDS